MRNEKLHTQNLMSMRRTLMPGAPQEEWAAKNTRCIAVCLFVGHYHFLQIQAQEPIYMKRNTLIPFLLLLSFTMTSCGNDERTSDPVAQLILENKRFFDAHGEVRPYKNSSLSEKVLKECVYVITYSNSCKLNTMPLLGMKKKEVTVDDVLSRTLVSHQFMGENFESALREIESEMLFKLFGATTAIIISNKITPSFYSSYNGVIYISGGYVWLTKEENKLAITKTDKRGNNLYSEDGRSSKLKFMFFTKRTTNGLNLNYTLDGARRLDQMISPLFILLLHELAHANDYMPYSLYSTGRLNGNSRFGDITMNRYSKEELISDQLDGSVLDKLLINFQDVYNDERKIPLPELFELTAEEVALKYDSEQATNIYAYSTPREDLAKLIDEAFGLSDLKNEVIQGIVSYPGENIPIAHDYQYPLSLAQKNRILRPKILARAMQGIRLMFPDFDEQKYQEKVKEFKFEEAPVGTSWYYVNSSFN
jgi:hypothetical protein